jgi:hypothetical protein
MKMVRRYGTDEDIVGFMPQIKARLLSAMRDWVARGWLLPKLDSSKTSIN